MPAKDTVSLNACSETENRAAGVKLSSFASKDLAVSVKHNAGADNENTIGTAQGGDVRDTWRVEAIEHREAQRMVVTHHYLHRRCPCSFAFGLFVGDSLLGVVTFGTPASHHLCKSICPSDPSKALELNRLWLCDTLPRNSESWFVSRCLHLLPPKLVLSYADTAMGHAGYVYRALNFHYAGWTDMERKTPRFDYIVPGKHTRDAFRGGVPQYTERRRRKPKVKYWIATGNRRDRRELAKLCAWPVLSWVETPHPPEAQFEIDEAAAA